MRVCFGDFVLDRATRQLSRNGEVRPLEPKAYALLDLLIRRRPAAVSKQERPHGVILTECSGTLARKKPRFDLRFPVVAGGSPRRRGCRGTAPLPPLIARIAARMNQTPAGSSGASKRALDINSRDRDYGVSFPAN